MTLIYQLIQIITQMFSAKGLTPIDRELSKKVVKIIHALLMMEQSAAFRKPVPHKALGLEDYKLIVKKPTDLNLIRRQNNEGKYKFVEQVLDEIQLCWDNCKLYNAIGSQIYNQALFMETQFDKHGIEILPDYWKGINREEYNQKFNQRKIEEEKLLKRPEQKMPVSKSQVVSSEEQRPRAKKQVTFQNKQQIYEPEEEVPEVKYDYRKHEKEEIDGENQENLPEQVMNNQKGSMDVEQADEAQQVAVEPILVNLSEVPSRQQLLELSELVKNLYISNDLPTLQKVLQILHSNQKQHMSLNKNGMMSFKMNKIHISTYYRIKKLVGQSEDVVPLIE